MDQPANPTGFLPTGQLSPIGNRAGRHMTNLRAPLRKAALAFRGYNVTNLGRTPELLAHPAYGAIVETHLREASDVFRATLKRPLDLVARVREGRETRGLHD